MGCFRSECRKTPFKPAIEDGLPLIMPCYSMTKGTGQEEACFVFNKVVVADCLQSEPWLGARRK